MLGACVLVLVLVLGASSTLAQPKTSPRAKLFDLTTSEALPQVCSSSRQLELGILPRRAFEGEIKEPGPKTHGHTGGCEWPGRLLGPGQEKAQVGEAERKRKEPFPRWRGDFTECLPCTRMCAGQGWRHHGGRPRPHRAVQEISQ